MGGTWSFSDNKICPLSAVNGLIIFFQEVLQGVCDANPDRVTGWEDNDHLPDRRFVYNFADRNNLSLRTTTELSNARQHLTYRDLDLWQVDTYKGLVANPKYAACFEDPRRIFNMDESPFSVGKEKVKVLAQKGTKNVLYHKSGSSREHLTLIAAINAAGEVVEPRVVFKNKTDIAKRHLK